MKRSITEAAGGKDALLELRANGGDRFYVLNGRLLDPAEPELANALVDAYARRSKEPVLSICGFDSDVSVLRLTDGEKQSALLFGLKGAWEGELPPYIEGLWKLLFKTQKAWNVLENLRNRRARGVEASEDAFFPESAVCALAKVLKFDGTAACGFPEESEAEVVWRSDWEEAELPLRPGPYPSVPDEEPPCFDEGESGMSNPCMTFVYSAGGCGRGVEATILACGFDAALCEIHDVELDVKWDNCWQGYRLLGHAERISAEDGDGWRVLFPDAEIQPGAPAKGRDPFNTACFTLRFPVFGAEFAPRFFRVFGGMGVELSTGEVGEWAGAEKGRFGGEVRPIPHLEVWIAPMENPAGGFRRTIALTRIDEEQLRKWRDPPKPRRRIWHE